MESNAAVLCFCGDVVDRWEGEGTGSRLIAAGFVEFEFTLAFVGFKEVGPFEQPTEVFFAGDMHGAGLAGEAGVGFVFHFEALQADDADVFFFALPNLALL